MSTATVYSFNAKALGGGGRVARSLSRPRPAERQYRTAECGFTPQYAGLQQLHERIG